MSAASAAPVLARAVAATRWRELSAEVREQAAAAPPGPCTVIGRRQGSGAAAAALVNGGATTVLQLQDGHRMARGHPASHVVPATLAMAEAQGASGDEWLSAFVAGYECAARVGIALGGLHERRAKALRLLGRRFGAEGAGQVAAAFDAVTRGAPLASLSAALAGRAGQLSH